MSIFDTERTIHYSDAPAMPWSAPQPTAPAPPAGPIVARPDTVEAGVTVPALQGAIIALPPAILVITLVGGAAVAWSWPWWIAPLAGLIAWSSIASIQTWRYIEHRQLWQRERAAGRDLDGDGIIGPPPRTIKVELSELGGRRLSYPDLGVPDDQLLEFARRLQNDENLSEGRWSGGGALFSRPAYIKFRQRLINDGLARWTNPAAHAQGALLTARGRAVFRAIAGTASSAHARARTNGMQNPTADGGVGEGQ